MTSLPKKMIRNPNRVLRPAESDATKRQVISDKKKQDSCSHTNATALFFTAGKITKEINLPSDLMAYPVLSFLPDA